MTTEYEFHEAAALFPLMDSHEADELLRDIKANGLLSPIELLSGKILDGRNRYRACLAASVEPKYISITVEDPVAYVLSRNLHRRHLTVSQRAMIAQKARAYYDQQAKERQAEQARRNQPQSQKVVTFPPLEKSKARDQAGALTGVSGIYVDRARRVIERGDPETVKAVESGAMTINAALKKIDGIAPSEVHVGAAGDQGERKINRRPLFVITDAQKFASMAISQLERIRPDDPERTIALERVKDWINGELTHA